MGTILEKDVKRVWTEGRTVFVELNDGRIGSELFDDYEPLRNAPAKALKKFHLEFDGVWFDELDEGLELSGFFRPKNAVSHVFRRFPQLNASAIARSLSITQQLFAAYVSGAKKPSAAREKRILAEIAKVGREMAEVAG